MNELKFAANVANGSSMILGRWLSRVLPAQTIGAGNWIINGLLRFNNTASADSTTAFGGCLAQWRPGTGVVARFFDSPTTGTNFTPATAQQDRVLNSTIAGGALTLLATDCLILEVWFTMVTTGAGGTRDWGFVYGGVNQLTAGIWGYQEVTVYDATLTAPAAITFS
jgi:hypothetical protein